MEGRLTGISTLSHVSPKSLPERPPSQASRKLDWSSGTGRSFRIRLWAGLSRCPLSGRHPRSLLVGLAAKVIQLLSLSLCLSVFLWLSLGFWSCYQLLSSLLISHFNSFSERISLATLGTNQMLELDSAFVSGLHLVAGHPGDQQTSVRCFLLD